MALFLDECRSVCDVDNGEIKLIEEDKIGIMRYEAELRNNYKKIFILLSKAVISGEYVFDKQYIEKLNDFLAKFSVEAGHDLKGIMEANFNSWVKESLNHYMNFVSCVRNKSDNTSLNLLFSAFQSNENVSNDYVSIFINIVIKLANIDHFLSFDKNIVIELTLIKEELLEKIKIDEENEEHAIYSILLDKCNFLLRKILHKSSEKDYSISSQLKTIDYGDIRNNKLNDLFIKFEYLYLPEEYKIHYKNRIDIQQYQIDCKNDNYDLESYKYIILIKNYQQETCSIEQIDNLIEQYDKYELKNSISGDVDKQALFSVKNYLYNSRLSFKMNSDGYNIIELGKDLKKIEDIQSYTQINNYYPYYKTLGFLSSKIDAFLKAKDCDILALKEIVEYYDKVLEKFKSKFEICKKLNYYPFQIDNMNCIVKCDDVNIFIASSFARPIDYLELERKLSEFKLKSSLLGYQLDLVQKVSDINDIKEMVANSNKRNFEYLGVFVAIITFLFASIPIFNNEKATVINSLLNMMSLGLVLCLFVLQIKIFNSMSKSWVGISFGALVILLIVLMCNLNNLPVIAK